MAADCILVARTWPKSRPKLRPPATSQCAKIVHFSLGKRLPEIQNVWSHRSMISRIHQRREASAMAATAATPLGPQAQQGTVAEVYAVGGTHSWAPTALPRKRLKRIDQLAEGCHGNKVGWRHCPSLFSLLSSATALASAFHPAQERQGGAHSHPVAKTPSSCAICARLEKCSTTSSNFHFIRNLKLFRCRLATVCLQKWTRKIRFCMILSFF